MARPRRDEERLMSSDERDLVRDSHQPGLKSLPDEEVAALLKQLRGRRDRARDIAQRQRRELRGKAAPSGRTAARDDTGTREKASVLASALKRVRKEVERRHHARSRSELVANARRAMALKRARDDESAVPESQTAHEGMRSTPNPTIAPSGALQQEGHRPVLERTRKVR